MKPDIRPGPRETPARNDALMITSQAALIEELRTAFERIRYIEGISRVAEKIALDALRAIAAHTATGEQK